MKDQELESLLSEMTLDEKIHQLLQLSAGYYTIDKTVSTGPEKECFGEEDVQLAGTVLCARGAAELIRIQKEYMEKHPHHIPLIFMLDVINGYRTVYQIPLGIGATFDPEIAEKCAEMSAKESAVDGIHLSFSPMADLSRDARWGRVMESTGEDPYLNGLMAAAMVRGYQGKNVKDPYRIGACVKHFAGYGSVESGRDYNKAEMSEHSLREYHLPAYQAGIDAGAVMVMSSFNTINDIPATGNKRLMRSILRDEMNFKGILISDHSAIEEMLNHGYCADKKDAAKRAIEAGLDIDMMTDSYVRNLQKLVEEGEISEQLVDEAVMRVLKLKNDLGLFENPYKDADPEKAEEIFCCAEHREIARKSARESFVLLKNEGIFPLDRKKKTALIGPYVDNRELLGAWSFIGHFEDVPTVREVFEQRGLAENIVFFEGSPTVDRSVDLGVYSDRGEEVHSDGEIEKMLEEAVQAAKEADEVVLMLGEHRLQSGEATSRGDIRIPAVQRRLFEKICEVNSHVGVVLFTQRPLDVREIKEKAKSILVVWMPGTEGANAIADVLTGEYNPSGKLPMSFPYCVAQEPIYYNHMSTGRPYHGQKNSRYYSKYMDIPNEPLYPFGYGLSYTTFEIGEVKLSSTRMEKAGRIRAAATVCNIGDRAGTETVQLYIHDKVASMVRPVKELKGIQKITLEPGESSEIFFEITEDMLSFVGENQERIAEPGEFDVFIGNDSTTQNKATFVLK